MNRTPKALRQIADQFLWQNIGDDATREMRRDVYYRITQRKEPPNVRAAQQA